MAYDYNRNGKSDLVDACIEYQLVNHHIEKSSSTPRRSNSGNDAWGCLGPILGAALALGMLWLTMKAPWIWAVAIGIIIFVLLIRSISNRASYSYAKKLFADGNYESAAEEFKLLGGRYDSQRYYSICRFIIIYRKTDKLTAYERKDFEELYNEAQRHYNHIPELYRTDDLPELIEYSSIKEVNDKAYKKYKEKKFLEKLAKEEPYIGMNVKHINDTKYGKYFDIVTISRDTDPSSFIDLKYQTLKKQNIKDHESVEEYIFYNEYGDDCHAYVYKGVVCHIKYNAIGNLRSKLPYVGLNALWVDSTKLGKYDTKLILTPHNNAKEYNNIKKLCPGADWSNQLAVLYIFENKAAKRLRKVYVHNEKVIYVSDVLQSDEVDI